MLIRYNRIDHIHKSGSDRAESAEGVYSAVIEEYILAKTDYRVITQDSGFVRLFSLSFPIDES